ncbi:hypothetical protein Pfo_023862 [Paulownia fortunei]|nr:hypothetical protein Pfo_023862 [Paulownia fortunei]
MWESNSRFVEMASFKVVSMATILLVILGAPLFSQGLMTSGRCNTDSDCKDLPVYSGCEERVCFSGYCLCKTGPTSRVATEDEGEEGENKGFSQKFVP